MLIGCWLVRATRCHARFTASGIPRLGVQGPWFNEALHGVASDCGAQAPNQADGSNSTGCPTSFSHGMALGSTFNRTLWTAVANAIGTEARAMAFSTWA